MKTRSSKPSLPLTFLSPLHRATRQIALHLEEPAAALGLAPHEAHLISYLGSYGPCPITELSRVFEAKPSTLTSMLDRLGDQGLLRRSPHPEDRRSLLIELTPDGRRVATLMRKLLRSLEARIQARVDGSEIAGFQAVMSAIAEVTQIDVRPRKEKRDER